jgi:3-hydroxy-D-aspartate aldolase
MVGMDVADVDTPALLLDLDAYERNLDRMSALVTPTGVALRPHAKMHKSPQVTLDQIARGAVGACVQKVAEAEVLVRGGIEDVLVSNEVVGASKVTRLADLAGEARIGVCADDGDQVAALSAAASARGVELRVLVEVDVGAGRCGVAPGAAAVRLAEQVASAPGLQLGGLQGYHGEAQHLRTYDERMAAVQSAAELLRSTARLLSEAGLPCHVISGGGTGTVDLDLTSGVWTEVQVGSYAFMDADYARNLDRDGSPVHTYEQALFVLSTVMSAARPGVAVVDAGLKALAVDSGLPLVHGRPGVTYVAASDEHGTLAVSGEAEPLRLGDRVALVPGHCDPTVDRFDWYVGLRSGRVESVWPVAARGAMY